MNREIRVLPIAEQDISRAHDWYEEQRPGLGQQMLNEVESCLARIAANPFGYQILHRSVRRALLKRFPYCVYFEITETQIVVLAILHARRDPASWRYR